MHIELSKCEVLLHSNSWKRQDRRIQPSILVVRNVQQRITQCAIDGFASFLRRWIPLNKGYKSIAFVVYHTFWLRCVLEELNCIMLDGWTLSGTRTVIPRSLSLWIPVKSSSLQYPAFQSSLTSSLLVHTKIQSLNVKLNKGITCERYWYARCREQWDSTIMRWKSECIIKI